jgi:hypothetical protein
MKKLSLLLVIVTLFVFSHTAYAVTGGHVATVEIHYATNVVSVDQAIAKVISADVLSVDTNAPSVTEDALKNEIGSFFSDPVIQSLVLPRLTNGVTGLNVVKVDYNDFKDVRAEDVRLFLRNRNGGEAIEIKYSEDPKDGQYAFVDENGKKPSRVATKDSPYLLLAIKDGEKYDFDTLTSGVDVQPVFAAKKSGGGGGGCDMGVTPFALMLLAGGFAIKASKKSK